MNSKINSGVFIFCVYNQVISWSTECENYLAKSLILYKKYRVNDSFVHNNMDYVLIDGDLFLANRFKNNEYIRILKLKDILNV